MDAHLQPLHTLTEVSDPGESRNEALYHLAALDQTRHETEMKFAHLVRENRSLKRLMAEISKDFEAEVLQLEEKSVELTKANDRMKLAEKVAKFGIWEANYTTQTISISEGMGDLLRLPADAPLEMNFAVWNRLNYPEGLAEMAKVITRATEEKNFVTELCVRFPDRTTRWYRVSAQGEFVAGRLVQRIGTTIDVTTERETLDALRDAKVALQSEKRELMDARERLRDQATHDGLTHLWNRAAILEILAHELERGRRQGHATGLVMADIDYFKAVNDTYGHQAGDAVLCQVTRRLSSVIRSYDSLGRYGGEEFLLVMPNCCFERDASRLEAMRLIIAKTPIMIGEVALAVTCSFGMVSSAPGGSAARDLIRLADEALYRAKAQGRNRVEVYRRTEASQGASL